MVSPGRTEDVEEKCPDLIAREVDERTKKNELILSMERLNHEALARDEEKPRRIIGEFLPSSGQTLPVSLTFGPFFGILFPVSRRLCLQRAVQCL
jgi:hypothetical protein